ncbi:hypothetical protein F5X68DRAFT_79051 [Plectosphaerella plurivora]|uniref:Uncharacterized protein n=1 Tax=Plectosphaerella plurivora TaxID=936078 RepID=A0A9P8VDC2_9PEZI|nr:hypothetical protein F5X68DRAFT_79051 [Plectosphaerella plurivora]
MPWPCHALPGQSIKSCLASPESGTVPSRPGEKPRVAPCTSQQYTTWTFPLSSSSLFPPLPLRAGLDLSVCRVGTSIATTAFLATSVRPPTLRPLYSQSRGYLAGSCSRAPSYNNPAPLQAGQQKGTWRPNRTGNWAPPSTPPCPRAAAVVAAASVAFFTPCRRTSQSVSAASVKPDRQQPHHLASYSQVPGTSVHSSSKSHTPKYPTCLKEPPAPQKKKLLRPAVKLLCSARSLSRRALFFLPPPPTHAPLLQAPPPCPPPKKPPLFFDSTLRPTGRTLVSGLSSEDAPIRKTICFSSRPRNRPGFLATADRCLQLALVVTSSSVTQLSRRVRPGRPKRRVPERQPQHSSRVTVSCLLQGY